MCVNPFWLGVAATILVEVALTVGICIIAGLKNTNNKEDEK